MMKFIFGAILFITSALSAQQCQQCVVPVPIPTGTTPTGSIVEPDGTYFLWQYQIGPKTIMVIIESGIHSNGLHQYSITLPATYNVTAVRGSADYASWCFDEGVVWHVDAGPDFLIGDKFLVLPGGTGIPVTTHATYNQAMFTAPIPTTTLLFNYYNDGSCHLVTDSMVLFFSIA